MGTISCFVWKGILCWEINEHFIHCGKCFTKCWVNISSLEFPLEFRILCYLFTHAHLHYPQLAMCFPKSIWLLRILLYPPSHVVAAVQNKLFDDKQKVDNHSRIYVWNCFIVKNDVLMSVLSVSDICSLCYPCYLKWKLQSNWCVIFWLWQRNRWNHKFKSIN